MGSKISSTGATAILDLNDDCLLEVFEYLDLLDLCSVADVCSRFRRNAKACVKYSNKKYLCLTDDIKGDGDTMDQFMRKASKILRHFGASFATIDGNKMCRKHNRWSDESKVICRQRIMELIVKYCSGTLTGLAFSGIDLTDEMLRLIRPMLGRLQKLGLFEVTIGESFVNMLPLWSPELRVLTLLLRDNRNATAETSAMRFDGLHQPFKKLQKISLYFAGTLKSVDIEEMLKANPQLKEIELGRCRNLDNQVVRSIVNCTPDIETLNLDPKFLEQGDASHFGLLRNLKILTFGFSDPPSDLEHIVSAIREIGQANIPLKKLRLYNTYCDLYADQFVEELSKLKTLEMLVLSHVPGYTKSHIQNICKYCPELREMVLQSGLILNPDFISEVIRTASDKLELLSISPEKMQPGKIMVDIGSYEKWAEIVEKRHKKTHLQIHLHGALYTTNMKPVKGRKPTFSLLIGRMRY